MDHRLLDVHGAPEAQPPAEAPRKLLHAHVLLLILLDHVQFGLDEVLEQVGDVAATVQEGQ